MKSLKKSAIVTASFCAILMATGCDKTSTDAKSTDAHEVVEKAQVDYMPISELSSEYSKMGAVGALNNFVELNDEQKECLQNIDKYYASDELEAYFKENFTEDELKVLNDYFGSDAGKKVTKYSAMQMLQAFGGEAPSLADAPTEEELIQVVQLSQEPAFVKYNNFTTQKNETGMEDIIAPLLEKEFERCNIDRD